MKLKNFFIISIIVLLAVFGNGCALFRNPLASWTKAEAKVDTTGTKLAVNYSNTVDEAGKYAYGTGLALNKETNRTPAVLLATDLNNKTIAVLGPPDLTDVVKLQTMVNDLLSTNAALVAKGNKQEASLDAQVINLQNQKEELEGKLATLEAKATKIATDNAGLAQKWSDLVKWFWWIVIGIGVIIVLRIVAAVCPPPYNSIVSILAVPFTLVVKGIEAFIPEALGAAGWVEAEYKTATQDLVNVIDGLKTANPALHPAISAAVATTVSDTAVGVINAAKTSQQIVS